VSRLVDVAAATRSNAAEPVIGIAETPPGPSRTPYLTVKGRPAFETSFWRGTCAILFQRRSESDSYLLPGQMRDRLACGLDTLDPEVVTAFLSLLTAGDYLPMLLEIRPLLVHPGDDMDYFTREQLQTWDLTDDLDGEPNDPKTPYYRLDGGRPRQIEPGHVLFEFLVPMTSTASLSPDTVSSYITRLSETAPTAVALSILDTAAPWDYPESATLRAQHWALTHFLMDGHHKTAASAATGQPLRLLSLLSLSGGNTDPACARAVPALMENAPSGLRWTGRRPLS
jgi:hypothetical protein